MQCEVWRLGDLTSDVREAASAAAPSPFQTPAFGEAFLAAGGDVRLVHIRDDARVLGHALVMEEETLGFTKWTALGAPAIRDEAAVEPFWEALLHGARARGVLSITWRDPTITRLSPADLAAAIRITHEMRGDASRGAFASQSLTLTDGADALWTHVHRKHRNIIRKAETLGVRTEHPSADAFLDAYMPLSDATWARSDGGGPPRPYFERLLQVGAADGWLDAILARDVNGHALAGALVTTWRGAAVYLHGASADDAVGASNLLQWRIMQDLAARGIATYDLGGGPLPGAPDDTPRAAGIRRFKERFGGAPAVWPGLHVKLDIEAYDRARAAVMAARARTD